jgi:tetratricopeptide (TPR) repeat protein
MECRRTAPDIAQLAVRIATWVVMVLVLLQVAINAAEAQEPAIRSANYVMQARQFEMQFRTGNSDVVPGYVAAMDEATRVDPDNADHWYWLGRAYLALAAGALAAGQPEQAMPAMQKGPAALMRALKLDPEHAPALAQIGGVQTLLGPVLGKPEWVTRGIGQMNKAVQIAPDSTRVRLQRAFLGMNLPDHLRDRTAESEDLDFLIDNADMGNAADYVRLLRGDLHVENGELQQALALYRSVEGTGTRASVDAAARLAAMQSGGVERETIRRLRAAAGAECAMCHRD